MLYKLTTKGGTDMAEKKNIRCQIHCQKGRVIHAEFGRDTGVYDQEGIHIEVEERT